MSREALWARLREAALVDGDPPAPDERRSPWFVRVMLGIAGWIGALFLLSFVGVGFAFLLDKPTTMAVTGALTCAAAATLFRLQAKSDVLDQFALALSLAGQAMLVFGLFQLLGNKFGAAALAITVQQAVLFALVPSYIHRVWTACTGSYAAVFALADAGLWAFAPAGVTAAFLVVWLREFQYPQRGELLRAGGYGLALTAVQAAVMQGSDYGAMLHGGIIGGQLAGWGGALASSAVLLWAVVALLRREGVPLASGPGRIALAGGLILALASLKAPGVGAATAILVIGYANGNRLLTGLGVFALIGYLSHYYYSLQATLLEKSALLAMTGLALLAARLALHRWWPQSGEAGHA